ncbi:hypothetical protein [Actinomadura hibisca]|uniref:hypothetical protein n=1 Tax=Actinomadura hibisca TaxID=68565 RepID=UPI000830E92D|nr:hypothetical protein [Actinomadura hibisca]
MIASVTVDSGLRRLGLGERITSRLVSELGHSATVGDLVELVESGKLRDVRNIGALSEIRIMRALETVDMPGNGAAHAAAHLAAVDLLERLRVVAEARGWSGRLLGAQCPPVLWLGRGTTQDGGSVAGDWIELEAPRVPGGTWCFSGGRAGRLAPSDDPAAAVGMLAGWLRWGEG